jgi:hypothetical protein
MARVCHGHATKVLRGIARDPTRFGTLFRNFQLRRRESFRLTTKPKKGNIPAFY